MVNKPTLATTDIGDTDTFDGGPPEREITIPNFPDRLREAWASQISVYHGRRVI